MYLANMWFQENGDWKLLAYSHPLLSQHQYLVQSSWWTWMCDRPCSVQHWICDSDILYTYMYKWLGIRWIYGITFETFGDGSVTLPCDVHWRICDTALNLDVDRSVTVSCDILGLTCVCDITMSHSVMYLWHHIVTFMIQGWIFDITLWHPALGQWHHLLTSSNRCVTSIEVWHHLVTYMGGSVTVSCSIHG